MTEHPFFHNHNFYSPAPDENFLSPLYNSVQAWGMKDVCCMNHLDFDTQYINDFIRQHKDEWIFFFLSYDCLSALTPVSPHPRADVSSPWIVMATADQVLVNQPPPFYQPFVLNAQMPVQHLSWEQYKSGFDHIMHHIRRGDIYEINYCIPFSAHVQSINTYEFWLHLCNRQPMPFSMFFDYLDFAWMSASPERFFIKSNHLIRSQPIKGTRKHSHPLDRHFDKMQLLNSMKDRTENVMTVDVTRNDLSKISIPGSVHVDELFGVYSFPDWYQLVSTVSAQLLPNIQFMDIIRAMFPMASMTGAPKIKAMELIHQFEPLPRGPFSGSLGYIDPHGNMDANVLIRSVFFNHNLQQLSFWAGGAITASSVAIDEYNECLLKSSAIQSLFNPSTHDICR